MSPASGQGYRQLAGDTRSVQTALRQEKTERVRQIKLERGCADCGYDRCAEALHFDHLPGEEKLAHVAVLLQLNRPWHVIEREMAKCDVVCANCHAERTVSRRAS